MAASALAGNANLSRSTDGGRSNDHDRCAGREGAAKMHIYIRGGSVLSQDGSSLASADILIEDDRITAVGPHLVAPADARVIDATERIVIPGLINAHTHAHNNLTRGTADRWTLEDLLNNGPALLAGRTPEEQYVSAAIGAVEMLRSGCTAAYDLFMGLPAPTSEGCEAVVRAYADTGMRAVLAPAVADIVFYRTVPDLLDLLPHGLRETVEAIEAAPADGLLRLTEAHVRAWDGHAGGRIRAAVAPTIPGQCSDAFLAGCGRLAREYGVGLHTHLAETKVQATWSQRRWGATIAGQLHEIGLLGQQFTGAHGVWLTSEDIALLAGAGASVVHNPASNLKLGSGIAPVREMLDAGLTVGLGTDGSMSSDNQNLFEAMRFAALVGTVRFAHDTRRWIGAADVWSMASEAGARVLGMADDLGALAPGRKADLVLLRAGSMYLRPLSNPLHSLVYVETGASVETVLVDGRVVVESGRVLTVDEDALRAQAQAMAEQLRDRNPAAWLLAAELTPYIAAACRAAVAVPFAVNRYAAPLEVPHDYRA
jgi:cytosine/adenosine deaminase-related metal-dependent hydrolase